MAIHFELHPISSRTLPEVCRITADRPWFWLAAAWEDFVRIPAASMTVGLLVTAVMLLVVELVEPGPLPALAAGVFAGMVFLGPVLAVGLYELSWRLEHQKPTRLTHIQYGWRRNTAALLTAGGVMLLLLAGWLLMSLTLNALLFDMPVSPATLVANVLGRESMGITQLLVFGLTGVVVMALVFSLMVVSMPMLVDRPESDLVTAMLTSLHAVRKNPAVMSLWALLIVVFTALAMAPLFLGLTMVFPLLAYASWHAYRDLLGQ